MTASSRTQIPQNEWVQRQKSVRIYLYLQLPTVLLSSDLKHSPFRHIPRLWFSRVLSLSAATFSADYAFQRGTGIG